MNTPLVELRDQYQASVSHASKAEIFWKGIKDYQGRSAYMLAYKAAALSLKAKHDWNPYNKLNWLKEALNIFEEAIRMDPDNIEIRFLRFSIEHYMPDFLGFSQHLEADKNAILKNIHHYQDFDLELTHLKSFHGFFEESKRFDQRELDQIKVLIQNEH